MATPTIDIDYVASDNRIARGLCYGVGIPVLVFDEHPLSCPLKRHSADARWVKSTACVASLPVEIKRSGFPIGEGRYKKLCWAHGQLYYDIKGELE